MKTFLGFCGATFLVSFGFVLYTSFTIVQTSDLENGVIKIDDYKSYECKLTASSERKIKLKEDLDRLIKKDKLKKSRL
jgi:hypothetical protein